MKNLDKYNVKLIEEINGINGGCFAYDVGWFIRTSFMGVAGYGDAVVNYVGHYANPGNCQ